MEPAEKSIREVLDQQSAVSFALLFGSRASGLARPDSDWDVALFLNPQIGPSERWSVRAAFVAALAPRVAADVTVLNDAPPLLAHRALQGRVLLMRNPTAYSRFFVRTMSEAGDDRYWNNLHAMARKERLAGGRFGRP